MEALYVYKCFFFPLSKISEFNTQNVIDISYMFYGYIALIFLSDISDWNTEKVINMSNMFNECASSKFLSDISKWNTNYLNDIS